MSIIQYTQQVYTYRQVFDSSKTHLDDQQAREEDSKKESARMADSQLPYVQDDESLIQAKRTRGSDPKASPGSTAATKIR